MCFCNIISQIRYIGVPGEFIIWLQQWKSLSCSVFSAAVPHACWLHPECVYIAWLEIVFCYINVL